MERSRENYRTDVTREGGAREGLTKSGRMCVCGLSPLIINYAAVPPRVRELTNPHDQLVLVLPRALTPKGHASLGVAHEAHVTVLQLRGMPSRHILTQLPYVLLAENWDMHAYCPFTVRDRETRDRETLAQFNE